MTPQELWVAGVQPVYCTLNTKGEWTPLVRTTGNLTDAPWPGDCPLPPDERYRLALRPPLGGILLDVDDHDGKGTGPATIAAMEKDLGPLPPTHKLTSRGFDQPTGRLPFRVLFDLKPSNAPFKAYGGAVDVIRTEWRYSWAPGDVNPRTGTSVVCYAPDGTPGPVPPVVAWPDLPEPWVDYLASFKSTFSANGSTDGSVRFVKSVEWAIAEADRVWRNYWDTPGDEGQGARVELMKAARVQTQCDQVTGQTTDLAELIAKHPDYAHTEPGPSALKAKADGVEFAQAHRWQVDWMAEVYDAREQIALAPSVNGQQPDLQQPPPDPTTPDPKHVAYELERMRARDAAQRIYAREGTGNRPRPRPETLTELLAQPDLDAVYRIGSVWPLGGSVVLAAPKKLGKSTLLANLVRSLVDGDLFLGVYSVTPVARVTLVDNEHDINSLRRWLRQHGIVNTDAVHILSLRGNVSSFDLLDVATRAEWADDLRGSDVVLLDCLRPVLDAIGLDENRDAGRFLVAFEELCAQADVAECLVVHHMGHQDGRGAERSRGDSRIRDWPYAEWKLVQEQTGEGSENPSGPRYFTAYGRDVNVPEARLDYDLSTRRLTLAGGTRRAAEMVRARAALLEIIEAEPGQSARSLDSAMEDRGFPQKLARRTRALAVREGIVRIESGEKRSNLHYLVPSVSSASDPQRTTPVVSASVRIYDAHHTHTTEDGERSDALTGDALTGDSPRVYRSPSAPPPPPTPGPPSPPPPGYHSPPPSKEAPR